MIPLRCLLVLYLNFVWLIDGLLTDKDREVCFNQFHNEAYKPHPDMYMDLVNVISRHGYPVETHEVETEDGYILTVYRIPSSSKKSSGVRPAVFLNHGLFANAHVWILQHGNRNLAFKLSNEGFDVWLSNCRGSKYSKLHRKLSHKNPDYWNFTFHEMGLYDVPAVIQYIRKVTKQEKIYYVAHSMGATEFFIAMIKKPYLNDYIATAVLYAPVAFNSHATSIAKTTFSPIADELFELTKDEFRGKLDAMALVESYLGERLGEFCAYSENACGLCAEINTMIFGFDAPQMNYTTLPLFFSCFPDFVSTKTLLHYSQLMKSKGFNEFDSGDGQPAKYDLSRITAPLVFVYSDNDNLATPMDVNITASQLAPGVLKENIRVDWPLWTHRDFIKGIDADKYVYDRTVQIFKEKLYG